MEGAVVPGGDAGTVTAEDAGVAADVDAGITATVDVDAGSEEVPEPSGPCEALPAGVSFGSIGVLDRAQGAPFPRVVLMGGGHEVDRASSLFVDGANGGDVLVLRATGSTDGYTAYFAEELPVERAPASVTTLLLEDPALASDPAVLCRVDGAEAIWLPGGDQFDYLVTWPDPVREAIARAVSRGVAIGGTSAGAMALSALAFDAALGGVTSSEALADPSDDAIHIIPSPIAPPALAGALVDTHFVARDREGRLLAFLQRAIVDGADRVLGVGLDESSALVIEDGAFTLLSDDEAQAFLYDAAGPEAADEGALNLEGVLRRSLDDGAVGAWPPSFADAQELSVVDGVVLLDPG